MLKLSWIQWMEIVGKLAILISVGFQLTSIADHKAERANAEIDVQQTAAYVTVTDTPILMLNTQLQALETEVKLLKLFWEFNQQNGDFATNSPISSELEAIDEEIVKFSDLMSNAQQKNVKAIQNYNFAIDEYRDLRLAQSWGSKLFPWIFLIGSILVLVARFQEFRSKTD